ncbi:hypothetical protein M0R45_026320 [Rubus argutus]|uniref:Uncharacterized protein n=1 Tax=Rubus argutus TaxID=59490 RepID=A0AAW1WWN5_RUBAR
MGNGRSATASGWVYGDLDGKLTAWLGSKDAAEGRFGDGVGGFDAGWLGLGFCWEEVPDLVLHSDGWKRRGQIRYGVVRFWWLC